MTANPAFLPDPDELAREEAFAAALELHRAYAELFGGPDGPGSRAARLVMADLERRAGFLERLDARDQTGRVDPCGLAFNEGARSLLLFVKRRLLPPRPPGAAAAPRPSGDHPP